MPLHLVATPIGHPSDITLRAIETLKTADVVVGEERKEVSKLLKFHGIEGKRLELLNEHSEDADFKELLQLCRDHNVALVSDCGTPGFCDPGARLVAACRAKGLVSSPIPGASSLMCLLAVSGQPMNQFLFRGFLPVEREERKAAIQDLGRERRPVILMDTPYRLERLLSELAQIWPERRALLGCNFTQPEETVTEASVQELSVQFAGQKAEFILALFPVEGGRAALGPKLTGGQKTGASRSLASTAPSTKPGHRSGAARGSFRGPVKNHRKFPKR